MKRRKSVKLPLDDMSVQRDFPPATRPAVCLIRAEHICGQGSLCLHVEGGFGRERSFTGLSVGEDNGEECRLDVLFQTVPSAFL